MKYIKLYISILFLISLKNSAVTTCSLTASTNWTVASSWSCGHVPTGSDNIYIPNGFTVTITTSIDLSAGSLTSMVIAGNLFFSGNTSTLLLPTTATITLTSTGTITTDVHNNSQKLKIGTNTVWSGNSGTITGPTTATSSSTPLPIELLEFTGTCITNGVQLNWITATEINNDYFLIEKSNDGYDWAQIAKIKGLVNSYATTKYIHIDYTSQNNLTYYRMSQVDLSGIKTVFKAIDVYCSDKDIKDQILLYPNPSSTELNIVLSINKLATNTNITLVNNAGQLIFETKVDLIKGVNSFAFPFDIPSGAYTVLFSSKDIVIPSQKLMVIKP